MTNKYPEWTCHECVRKVNKGFEIPHGSTFHTGKCDVCGEKKSVTDTRSYGYPNFKKEQFK